MCGVPQGQLNVEPGQPQSSHTRNARPGPEEASGLIQSGEATPYIVTSMALSWKA